MDNKITFEEAFEKLQEYATKIKSSELGLEDSIKCCEEGIKYYKICKNILENSKQKIETFDIDQ